MEAGAKSKYTIAQRMIWVGYMFNMTDSLAEKIPGDVLDWRMDDPTGRYHWSLAELIMHVCDARRMFSSQLTGNVEDDSYWSPEFWTGDDDEEADRKFRPYGNKRNLMESLAETRGLFRQFLELPEGELHEITDGARSYHDRTIEFYKGKGVDTAGMELMGPPTINQVLFAVCCHESGHRGSLGTLMRMRGLIEDEE